jgi:hypothetical protein
MKNHITIILCAALSIVVLHTCIQVEVWNHLAGGNVLPNHEGGKLRYSMGESEKGWRVYQSMRTQDESLKSGRPLIEDEQALFREHSKHVERRNKVVSWSRGMGTLQYLLAPIAIIWSVVLLIASKTRRARLIAGLLTATNALSIVSMLYRGYLND